MLLNVWTRGRDSTVPWEPTKRHILWACTDLLGQDPGGGQGPELGTSTGLRGMLGPSEVLQVLRTEAKGLFRGHRGKVLSGKSVCVIVPELVCAPGRGGRDDLFLGRRPGTQELCAR